MIVTTGLECDEQESDADDGEEASSVVDTFEDVGLRDTIGAGV